MKRHQDGPFFAYYPMALVHAPHIAPPDSPHSAAARKAAAQDKQGKGVGKKAKRQAAENLGADDTTVNDPANFPDMMAYMDKLVGKMVAALDRLGLRENTLILFTGDNGTDRKITSRMGGLVVPGGKGTVTEIGAHVPLVASWPGTMPAGRTSLDLIDFSDVLPTLAEVAGANLPAGVAIDGHSFAPQLRGQKSTPREWVFTQLSHQRFARDGRYLLHEDGRLYDIPNDLLEKKDLSGSDQPGLVAVKKRLQAVLERCR